MRKMTMSAMFLALVVLLSPTERVASAHATGTELRTAAQCSSLQGPLRGHCLECVARPRPHHFHPDVPAGERCRADNGKP